MVVDNFPLYVNTVQLKTNVKATYTWGNTSVSSEIARTIMVYQEKPLHDGGRLAKHRDLLKSNRAICLKSRKRQAYTTHTVPARTYCERPQHSQPNEHRTSGLKHHINYYL